MLTERHSKPVPSVSIPLISANPSIRPWRDSANIPHS